MVVPLRTGQSHKNTDPMKPIPRFVLWAWELPEDLRFIDPKNTAVAFLADTIHLHGDATVIQPRLQPLRVPEGAKLVSVVRIEAERDAALDHGQIERTASTIAKTASLPRVVAVQVDFDATRSEREFYRALLFDLRHRLGPATPISITALASWCFGDDWISSLPINEAVPMLFRMGADRNEIVATLTSGRDFRAPVCRESLGVSSDERWASLPGGRRLYVFHNRPWTEDAEMALLREVQRWP